MTCYKRASFIARALILFKIYKGGTLCPPPLLGSETQKKPRQNRVKNLKEDVKLHILFLTGTTKAQA